ncbi:MAG: phosphoenolpyruvate carboxykinase (GTP) [Chlamydiae bacterium]|nr:phosphoenolpyruvate carboxykinase (GTP) [Chlamydiota bacterium]
MDVSSALTQIQSPRLAAFVHQVAKMCRPSAVEVCDGSEQEYQRLTHLLIKNHTFIALDPTKRPNSFWCRSDPSDVARVEQATYICSRRQDQAGPTNNWMDPQEMKQKLLSLFEGCMEGRTLYVIPFSMGPIGHKSSFFGVQITDSPYVVCSMKLMTYMGKEVFDAMGNDFFVPCIHSVGYPLRDRIDLFWPCNTKEKYIVHFPEEKSVWSYGSGYGGNALLGKKSLALRIASVIGKQNRWLAEHMLIVSITNPEGKKKYFAAAFPSQCGKTNLALMESKLPGWKVECIGDDIAWLRWAEDGQLWAINPERGFFGVAPGTSTKTNPHAMQMISKNTIFTNVALTKDLDVWWEGKTDVPPEGLISWEGKPWRGEGSSPAAHPNGRFTVATDQCPVLDPAHSDPRGVPISAILFGGRRSNTIPLVTESLDWDHGVLLGSMMSSETTAACNGKVGMLRHDPFAMLPFCGYHIGDYFSHWIDMGKEEAAVDKPLFFYVNWFLKDKDQNFIWPGFGENIRVLKWIFERCEQKHQGYLTPIGRIPRTEELDLEGLSLSQQSLQTLFHVDDLLWQKEIKEVESFFSKLSDKLPSELLDQLHRIKKGFANSLDVFYKE